MRVVKENQESTYSFYPDLRSGWVETEKTQKGAILGQIPKFVQVCSKGPWNGWMEINIPSDPWKPSRMLLSK